MMTKNEKKMPATEGVKTHCQKSIKLFFNKNRNDQYDLEEVCMTVMARFGTGGGNTPLVLEKTYQRKTGTLSPGAHAGSYNGQDAYNDMLVTEKKYELHASSVWSLQGIGTGICSETEGLQGCNGSDFERGGSTEMNEEKKAKMVVRRLTPLECERLQGFPDGWTDIGEWTDTKGKVHQPADSPRYKALGNSIATPFWFYLLRRISAQYERPATLGSLFDGIGGFPYCWEKCNGEGTAIWASEVEPFCIAVTKKRFPDE